jgi:hypothetical protein
MNTEAQPTGPLPATLNLISSTETLVPSVNVATVPLSVACHPDTGLEQTPFELYASGIITTGSSTNLTLKLYQGLTITSGNLMGSSGAIAQNGTTSARVTASWYVHAIFMIDSVSGTLVGKIDFYVNETIVAAVTLSNFNTGFINAGNPSANPATVSKLPQFVLSVTSSGATGTTNANTFVNVQKFSVG